MTLKYLRIHAFYRFLRPYQEKTRKKRMRSYASLMGIRDGMSILDLGGLPTIWKNVSQPLHLTILNLPGAMEGGPSSHHEIWYVEGDACRVSQFEGRVFDSVFSNSVIEHVGALDKREAFASEVRRLGKSYWVQTPSRWFPIEAHNGMPFWWLYPAALRRYLIKRWRKKLPEWTEMIEHTTVLDKREMRRLFPEAAILTERYCGIPKSYIAYFSGKQGALADKARSGSAFTALRGTAK
jgi:hypothetical protein